MLVRLIRRPARLLLTIGGMACGVFALTLLGAMAEHFNLLGRHFEDLLQRRVYVCEKPTFWAGGGILAEEKASAVAAVPGVAEVIPLTIGRLQPRRMFVLGLPEVMVGVPPAQSQALCREAPLASGRWLDRSDAGAARAVLGSDVAATLDGHTGGTVRALGRSFTVVGILARTGALEDVQMLVPLPVAQDALSREGVLTSMVVVPRGGVDGDALAHRIHAAVPGLDAISPRAMAAGVRRSLRLWQALTLGAGLAAAATGSLCIVITMLVSVHERTHEIGVKKAVGASNGQIVSEFMAEAAALALMGWALGDAMTGAFVAGWDAGFRREGIFLFSLTARVLAASLGVSLVLGAAAGSLPAWAAARLDPVAALGRRP